MAGNPFDSFLEELVQKRGDDFGLQGIRLLLAGTDGQYTMHCYMAERGINDNFFKGDMLIGPFLVRGMSLSEFDEKYQKLLNFDLCMRFHRNPIERLDLSEDDVLVSYNLVNRLSDPQGKETLAMMLNPEAYLRRYGPKLVIPSR
jgi:hypothetical protein